MAIGDDEVTSLLRLLRERRAEYVEAVALGGAPPENVVNGYMQVTGRVQGIDVAIEIVKDVFAGWLPPEVKAAPARKIVDY